MACCQVRAEDTRMVRCLSEMMAVPRVFKPIAIVSIRGQAKSRKPCGTALSGGFRNPGQHSAEDGAPVEAAVQGGHGVVSG